MEEKSTRQHRGLGKEIFALGTRAIRKRGSSAQKHRDVNSERGRRTRVHDASDAEGLEAGADARSRGNEVSGRITVI